MLEDHRSVLSLSLMSFRCISWMPWPLLSLCLGFALCTFFCLVILHFDLHAMNYFVYFGDGGQQKHILDRFNIRKDFFL